MLAALKSDIRAFISSSANQLSAISEAAAHRISHMK
jgi:hypothetical protein